MMMTMLMPTCRLYRQQTYKRSLVLVQIPTSVLVLKDNITYFQFQFLLFISFYTVVAVK